MVFLLLGTTLGTRTSQLLVQDTPKTISLFNIFLDTLVNVIYHTFLCVHPPRYLHKTPFYEQMYFKSSFVADTTCLPTCKVNCEREEDNEISTEEGRLS